jgi:hypothetical protein
MHRLIPRFFFLASMFPLAALAMEATGDRAPTTSEAIIGAVLALLVPILVKLVKDWRQEKAESDLALVFQVAKTVFWLTEEAKRLWPDKVPDAVAFATAKFVELMAAHGKVASPTQITLAKAQWGALHGASLVPTMPPA